MRAELVMIGTELLLGETVDTNASYLAQGLAEIGIDVFYKTTVGDNWLRMTEILSQALSRADVVITSGGLGPTMDDLTRECVASILNYPLALDTEALETMRQYFHTIGRTMSQNNRKQAYLPQGAVAIPNRWGTAPGLIAKVSGRTIFCLPGVPRELKGMFRETVLPYLAHLANESRLVSKTLHFIGIGESQLEELIKPILLTQSNPTIAPYASYGEVKLRISAKAQSNAEALALIKPIEQQICAIAGKWLYGVDSDTIEGNIANALMERTQTLATAESCTGGLISHRLTNIPGSSTFFERGFITYSNKAKMELLNVSEQLLQIHGAVSSEVAVAMAEGARKNANTHWGLSVTGIAGPGGGTVEKPVGLVHMAVVGLDYTKAEVYRFQGTREEIKYRVSQVALNLLRLCIKE